MFFVYVLYSLSTNRYYVGLTPDLGRRLNEHNSGTNASTKKGKPWVIVHEETFETRIVARERKNILDLLRAGVGENKI